MFKPKSISLSLTPEQFARLPSLFYSFDERLAVAGGVGRDTPIKDAAFALRLLDLLESQGFQKIRLSAFYRRQGDDALIATITVTTRVPSLVVRLFFDEDTGCAVQVSARRMDDQFIASVYYYGRRVVDIVGCLVLCIALGACILPGFAVLYFLHQSKKTWSAMTEAVAQALRETLA